MFPPQPNRRPGFLPTPPDKVGVSPPRTMEEEPALDIAEAGVSTMPRAETVLSKTTPEPYLPSASPASLVEAETAGSLVEARSTPLDRPGAFDLSGGTPGKAPDLYLEAINPVPPHLRNPGVHLRISAHGSRRRPPDPTKQKSVCASCSKLVVNLRMSGPCPRCLRLICNDCLREAFLTNGRGWCDDCAATQLSSLSESAA